MDVAGCDLVRKMSEDLVYRLRNYHYLGKHKEVVQGWQGYQQAGGTL